MLYQRVYDDLRAAIESGEIPIGSTLPRESALRDKYEVSSITIRRALSMLRDDGFVRRRPRVGTTVIAQSPQQVSPASKDPVVALIMTSFNDAFGTRIVEGVLDRAQDRAHIMLMRTGGDTKKEREAIKRALGTGARGLILLPSSSQMIDSSVLKLVSAEYPLTIIDRRYDSIPVAAVTSDHMNAGIQATTCLIEAGHRHIALFGASRSLTSNADRHRGWVAAHAINDVALDESLACDQITSTTPGNAGTRKDDIKRIGSFLRNHPEVTSAVACEFAIAVLLEEALANLGKSIPRDLSLVCFDEQPFETLGSTPQLTHIAQQQEEIGARALDVTLQQIDGGATADKIVLPTTLVPGNSVRPI